MNYRSVAQLFSQISGIYDKFLNVASGGRIHAWQRDLIDNMCPEGNWLDVGTGTGEILKKLGTEYKGLKVGLDPAEGMIRVAREKCLGSHFVVATAENLPFKDESFKNVSLSLVFRHLQDRRSFLKEANRILQQRGRIGILDVGKFKGTSFVVFLMKLLTPVGSLIFSKDKWDFFIHSVEEALSPQEVEDLLTSEGFSVLEVKKKLFGLVYIVIGVKTVQGT